MALHGCMALLEENTGTAEDIVGAARYGEFGCGMCLRHSESITNNPGLSLTYLKLAADQGVGDAQWIYLTALKVGLHITRNRRERFEHRLRQYVQQSQCFLPPKPCIRAASIKLLPCDSKQFLYRS
jgi:hypothetical protein